MAPEEPLALDVALCEQMLENVKLVSEPQANRVRVLNQISRHFQFGLEAKTDMIRFRLRELPLPECPLYRAVETAKENIHIRD